MHLGGQFFLVRMDGADREGRSRTPNKKRAARKPPPSRHHMAPITAAAF